MNKTNYIDEKLSKHRFPFKGYGKSDRLAFANISDEQFDDLLYAINWLPNPAADKDSPERMVDPCPLILNYFNHIDFKKRCIGIDYGTWAESVRVKLGELIKESYDTDVEKFWFTYASEISARGILKLAKNWAKKLSLIRDSIGEVFFDAVVQESGGTLTQLFTYTHQESVCEYMKLPGIVPGENMKCSVPLGRALSKLPFSKLQRIMYFLHGKDDRSAHVNASRLVKVLHDKFGTDGEELKEEKKRGFFDLS